jgi:hypothetical protein
MMTLEDVPADPEAQPGSMLALGGEEGVEDFWQIVLLDPRSGVADGDADSAFRRSFRNAVEGPFPHPYR